MKFAANGYSNIPSNEVERPRRKQSKMKRKFIFALAAGSFLVSASFVAAQTATGSMAVGAQVTRNCTLTAESLAFGDLSVEAVNKASAVVTLACNGVSTVTTILVGMGENPETPTTQRRLVSGTTEFIPYTLHVLEAGGADILTEGAVTLVKVGTTNTYVVTLYGEIEQSTAYAMGAYSDNVILTAVYAP